MNHSLKVITEIYVNAILMIKGENLKTHKYSHFAGEVGRSFGWVIGLEGVVEM